MTLQPVTPTPLDKLDVIKFGLVVVELKVGSSPGEPSVSQARICACAVAPIAKMKNAIVRKEQVLFINPSAMQVVG